MRPEHFCYHASMGGYRLTLDVMRSMAEEQGGECLSTSYRDLKTQMQWRCAAGHTWIAQAQSVRSGHWCKRCNGKPLVTIDDMKRIARALNGECLSEVYLNAETKLSFRCGLSHRWNTTPHIIRAGYWCPKCANVKRRVLARASNAERKRNGA